jgi:hypothetical protein
MFLTFSKKVGLCIAVALSITTTSLHASEAKTLITYDGVKASPGLATSWKKSKGNYTFVLNKKADIGQGPKSLSDVVKSSLESKLAASNGVKVTIKGADTVIVAYTGDEKAFLTAVGKTRIRAEQNVEIAMESTVSGGGIRAKTSERGPEDGEVKGTVINSKGESVLIRVITASAKAQALGIKDGDRVEVKQTYTAVKGDPVFFTPTVKVGNAWSVSSIANK